MGKADTSDRVTELLHEAAETHHVVYRWIVDGDDPDWASSYTDWLLDLSELPKLIGKRPVRSHLVHALVELDRGHTAESPRGRWEGGYAERLADTASQGTPGVGTAAHLVAVTDPHDDRIESLCLRRS